MYQVSKYNQSLSDFCIKESGTIEQFANLCFLNNKAYDYTLTQGENLEIPKEQNSEIISFLKFITPINNEYNEGTANVLPEQIAIKENINSYISDNVVFGQQLADYCILKYGDISQYSKLCFDNSYKYDSGIQQGAILEYDKTLQNQNLINFYTKNRIIPINFENNSEIVVGMLFTDNVQMQFTDGTDINFLT